MGKINRSKYPELDHLLWDIHKKYIDPETAFKLYERRWGFVDRQHITNEEKGLINRLVQTYGNGHFMPATC